MNPHVPQSHSPADVPPPLFHGRPRPLARLHAVFRVRAGGKDPLRVAGQLLKPAHELSGQGDGMGHAGLRGGLVPQGSVEIEVRQLEQACLIPARPGQQQAQEIGFDLRNLISQHFQQPRHFVRLNKTFPRVHREFLDSRCGIFPLVDLPVFCLHVHRMQILNCVIPRAPALGRPDRMKPFEYLQFCQIRQLDSRELAELLSHQPELRLFRLNT